MTNHNLSRKSRKYRRERDAGKIIIYTEGNVTEPEYLNNWIDEYAKQHNINKIKAHTKFKVEPSHDKSEPMKVVDSLIQSQPNYEDVDSFYAVFDEDDRCHSGKVKTNFVNAIQKAEKNNIKVICSNRSVELWALLHFEDAKPIDDCSDKLKTYMPEYDASRNKRFDVAKMLKDDNQEKAKERAKKLRKSNIVEGRKWYDRPSTNFDELIEAMENKIKVENPQK